MLGLHEIEKKRHQIWSSTLIWLEELFFNDSLINPLYMEDSYIEIPLKNCYFLYKEIFGKIGRIKSYQFLPYEWKLTALKRKAISLEMSRMILTKSTKGKSIYLLFDSISSQSSCSSHTLQGRSHNVTTH